MYTGKLCHREKCHSGNCHSGEWWMSRPFVHSGNLNFKHTLTNDLVFHNALKMYHLSLYNIKKGHVVDGDHFAMLSMPSFDFHLPPCMEGFLIHLSPLWQLPLWQLPLFPSVAPISLCSTLLIKNNFTKQNQLFLIHLTNFDEVFKRQYALHTTVKKFTEFSWIYAYFGLRVGMY